jgi:hypothetical protein
MTFNAPSFFVGVGTVLVLLIFGFGGGVLVSGIVSDTAPREPSRVERRAAAPEAAPPATTTKPVAVAPAPTDLQASTPNSDPSPKPGESANAPVEPPQDPAFAQQPAQPVTPAAETVTPPLGPQQPVALVNPDQAQDRGTAITQQAKQLADKRKNAERRKKAERPRQRETRQVQQRAPAGPSAEVDADGDVRGARPFFMPRERHEFGGRPLFRFFSNED